MLHLAHSQMKNIEKVVVRRSKYYISKFICNIFKEQIQCLEFRNIFKTISCNVFLREK